MDFSFIKVYGKFYISQILHSLSFIEYNNINYYFEQEMEGNKMEINEGNEKINKYSAQKSISNNELLIKENNQHCDSNENYSQICQENLCLNESNEENKLEKNDEFSNLFITPQKNNVSNYLISNTEKFNKISGYHNETIDSQIKKNLFKIEKFDERKISVKPHLKYQLIEPTNENLQKYKKLFVHRDNIYSKVEIQGIVTEKKLFSNKESNFQRFLLTVDDTTGVIPVVVWKSKNENIYSKIRDDTKCGVILRIIGSVDIYKDTSQIIMEYFEIVKNWNQEIIFHKSLQINQKNLKICKLAYVISLLNKKDNDSNRLLIFSDIKNTDEKKSKNLNEIKKLQNYQKKDFANRILAFFKKYRLNDEIKEENDYIIFKINSLITNDCFSKMMIEFCESNNINNHKKFLIDTFSLIEEHSMGRLIEDNETIEIKLDKKIDNEIIKMLKENLDGLEYSIIFDNISKLFGNFFMNDYVRYVIEELTQEGKIQSINSNFFQILI